MARSAGPAPIPTPPVQVTSQSAGRGGCGTGPYGSYPGKLSQQTIQRTASVSLTSVMSNLDLPVYVHVLANLIMYILVCAS